MVGRGEARLVETVISVMTQCFGEQVESKLGTNNAGQKLQWRSPRCRLAKGGLAVAS